MAVQAVSSRETRSLDRFTAAAELLQLTRAEQARLLGLSLRTYQRRLQEGRLEPAEVAAAQLLPEALDLATRLFGSESRAQRWLTSRVRVLGTRPVDLLHDLEGYKKVEAALGGAVYGQY